MKLFTWMQNTVQYLFDGVSRLFKATDDDYPKTGVQPFSGDPCDDPNKYSWLVVGFKFFYAIAF